MSDQGGSFARRALAALPGLSERVAHTPEFEKWLASHSDVLIDESRFYVVGGDMLKDYDEMVLAWARQQGLVDQSTIDRLQSREPSERSP